MVRGASGMTRVAGPKDCRAFGCGVQLCDPERDCVRMPDGPLHDAGLGGFPPLRAFETPLGFWVSTVSVSEGGRWRGDPGLSRSNPVGSKTGLPQTFGLSPLI